MSIAIGIVVGGLLAVGIMTILPVLLANKPAPKPPEAPEAREPARTRACLLRLEFMRLVSDGRTAVYLTPSTPGVEIPERFRDMASVRLDFSYLFSPPDLIVSSDGIMQTLSFRGIGAFPVFVPWAAISSIVRAPSETDDPPAGLRVFRLIPGGKDRLN